MDMSLVAAAFAAYQEIDTRQAAFPCRSTSMRLGPVAMILAPCGSGEKFKRCCIDKEKTKQRALHVRQADDLPT